MTTRASDIADFYQQLALLVRSELPLPDSLIELAKYCPRRDFQEAVLAASDRVAKGEKLADAVAQSPRFFDPFHVQLIAA